MYKNLSTLAVRKYYKIYINFQYLCILQYLCKTYNNIFQRHTIHLPVSIVTVSTWLPDDKTIGAYHSQSENVTFVFKQVPYAMKSLAINWAKRSWYQISQWHFQPLSSSTVMTEKEEVSKMLDINTILIWPIIWHDFTAHSHTRSLDPLKLQCYILITKGHTVFPGP